MLYQLEEYLLLNKKLLRDFPNMPIPLPRFLDINHDSNDLDQLIHENNITQLSDDIT